MKNKPPINRLATAQVLGQKAFVAGKPCAPALDSKLINLLNPEVGTNAPILKAWIKGWTEASLSADIQ
jgi:hypothetical protein